MLPAIHTIPRFVSGTYQEGEFRILSTSDLSGVWSAFVFYQTRPGRGSLRVLKSISSLYPDFKRLNAEIYAIFSKPYFLNSFFASWLHEDPIPFVFIGNATEVLRRAFGVKASDESFNQALLCIADPEGTILKLSQVDLEDPKCAELILESIKKTQVEAKTWKIESEYKRSLDLLARVRNAGLILQGLVYRSHSKHFADARKTYHAVPSVAKERQDDESKGFGE